MTSTRAARTMYDTEKQVQRDHDDENCDPNCGSNALGNLISSRLKDAQTGAKSVASIVTRLETNISASNTPLASPSKHDEPVDTFEVSTGLPKTGPAMLQPYQQVVGTSPPRDKIPGTEPDLRTACGPVAATLSPRDDRKCLEDLKGEAYENFEKATSADEVNDSQQALDLYILVVFQFKEIVPLVGEEEAEALSKTIEAICVRIETLREFLSQSNAARANGSASHSDEEKAYMIQPDKGQLSENAADRPDPELAMAGALGMMDLRHRPQESGRMIKTKSMTKSLPKEHYVQELAKLERDMVSIMNGGDTTGGGHGKSVAFMINLKITNLNISTFGEMTCLRPLPEDYVSSWRRFMKVFFLIAETIVVRVSETTVVDGRAVERMVDKPRPDIAELLPFLQQQDEKIINILRGFKSLEGEVEYVKRNNVQLGDKWWIEQPVIKPGGLSPGLRAQMRAVYNEVSTIFTDCHRVNTRVLDDMEVPHRFLTSLPKHVHLLIAKGLINALTTWTVFSIEQYLRERNVWNAVDAWGPAVLLEKTALIWKMKLNQHEGLINRFWKNRTKISCAQKRAENAVKQIKEAFPSMRQTKLDEIKVNDNTDHGKSILEAYSRALETRAARIMERVKKVLDADMEAQRSAYQAQTLRRTESPHGGANTRQI
mmetsp:Transcript_8094/g.24379  ORF Transcript_8094/g.24379 Transcript_8094/m.24379 type:complete len:658 (+) Transcript_8094:129-2102(+)|eukprot:CAMPEP_0198730872 /NCGR_PEP_ID=MMETSP1475-20131203/26792_1 /TAXON_ID= ORGANISM="Unidentified sp., Strain CCMP1999" /NCGR_SAMPLE_ID=MMETSP1475 /ASSEMBLY_ACC=CAM_ASM_001111 /LENGTH=657 /DNA_ID=CAMNT_0044493741 /DNA_START=40 /DNA_END=2013 /DNA_ORIENTATION=-